MGPELEELDSPSAGTGVETPGQQCPPNEGTRETGRTTAGGFLTAGVGFIPRRKYFVTHGMRGHENVCRHLVDSCYPRKPQAQDT